MRMLSMIVALGLSVAVTAAAAAEFSFSARVGIGNGMATAHKGTAFNGNIVNGRRVRNPTAGNRGTRGRRAKNGHHEKHKTRGNRDTHRHRESGPRHNYFPYLYSNRDPDYYVEPVPEPAEVAPPPPVAVAPPPPPDPRGPLRRTLARGITPIAVPYSLGEALPPDLPHVTLNWRQFDLPEPPPGQLYARVGHDVLLITASGRIVESVVPPG